eukprot:gnl/TRDRNA2_/TRDRNA2_29712_c0_seq1.p1 gnl/TRDRNA2_/TRDRNA2_29712_c0~~gnl/TRDRNA2_/TRDRNA2_29712_c0_seq1.p1  ORF type:complete len:220 (+),score=50.23 gnl/TRDRNA2_/TRDRNA2_29712_c0_seq1:54-662(+)
MAVDICAMQECLRWEGVEAVHHLNELVKFGEFNYFISEYFDPPAPAVNTLDALAALMGWPSELDTKQIVTKITGQRHTEEQKFPAHFKKFVDELKARGLASLSESQQEVFRTKLCERIAWQKFDHERERYNERTPMNSYDVLKCSQACFHLFEWLGSLLPEEEKPPRYVEIDIKAYREKEKDLKAQGCWPEEPPQGPEERTF